ncbi:MAG: MgtC/SapB family protein [Nanoarchaeota archaeon]
MFDVEFIFRIFLAALLGGLIGFDREKHHKPAGLRTHILVAIGAAVFTVISVKAFPDDPARIAANIVVGIGFLGAGTIWRAQNHVQGLTTAASLWATAGVAFAIALGFYWEGLAVALLVFLVLEFVKVDELV